MRSGVREVGLLWPSHSDHRFYPPLPMFLLHSMTSHGSSPPFHILFLCAFPMPPILLQSPLSSICFPFALYILVHPVYQQTPLGLLSLCHPKCEVSFANFISLKVFCVCLFAVKDYAHLPMALAHPILYSLLLAQLHFICGPQPSSDIQPSLLRILLICAGLPRDITTNEVSSPQNFLSAAGQT